MGDNKVWHIKLGQDQAPCPCVKAGHCNLSQGMDSNKLVYAPGIDPGPTARDLSDSLCFTTVYQILYYGYKQENENAFGNIHWSRLSSTLDKKNGSFFFYFCNME